MQTPNEGTATSRQRNVNLNYGVFNTQVAIEGIISLNRDALSGLHQYHKSSCLGEIGHKNYCKKCGELAPEIIKGAVVGGKFAPITKEEMDRFKTPSGIMILGITNEVFPEWQLKKVYLLNIGTEKKIEKFNKINYMLMENYLQRSGVSFVVRIKKSSAGFKSGGDLALIRYNAQYNRLFLIELYYAEEIKDGIQVMPKTTLPEEALVKVADRTFGSIASLEIGSVKEEHTEKVLNEIEAKLGNPLEEGTTPKPQEKPMSEEEALLMRMV